MKPAWISYIRKILWRYPQNYPKENEAIQKAMSGGVPDAVRLMFFEKTKEVDAAEPELLPFLTEIAKNLGLPTE